MTADGRLRQLHNVADLGDGKLAAFQNSEDSYAKSIGKNCQLIDDGSIHPYNRMKE
jgi:hypothetical protein